MSLNQIYELYIEAGVIRVLISILDRAYSEYPNLQENASWILCNFTAGEPTHVNYAVNNGILENLIIGLEFATGVFLENVKILIHYIVSKCIYKCLWILANLAGESFSIRDSLLEANVVDKVLQVVHSCQGQKEIIRTAIWLLSNLARGSPYPPAEKVSIFLDGSHDFLDC